MSANDKNISRAGSGTGTAGPGSAAGNKKQGDRMQGIVAYYIRYSIPEFIFCLVSAVALDVNMVYGFRLTGEMRTSYGLFIGVTAVVLVLLFIFNYSTRTKLIMLPVFAAAAVILVALCYRAGFSLIETDTREDNWGLCILILIIIAVLAFAASRTRVGSGIFAVAGSFAHAWLCVLLYTFFAWALVVFILAAGVMYLYSRYRHQMLNADARRHAFLPLLRTSLLAMAATLALAAGAFFGIVKPLNPPVLDITLITEVLRPETLEVVGIASTETVMDPDSYASDVDEDNKRDSNELNDQQQPDETEEDAQDAAPEDAAQTDEDLMTEPDDDVESDSWTLLSMWESPVFRVILICIAAFLAVMGIRRFACRHKIWLKKLQAGESREEQVRRMYHLFRDRLAVLGISGSPYDAPVKQAQCLAQKTMLMDEGGATWAQLSFIFARMAYGGIPPTEEEYNKYITYYHHFWKACKKYCGFRWLWKKFRM